MVGKNLPTNRRGKKSNSTIHLRDSQRCWPKIEAHCSDKFLLLQKSVYMFNNYDLICLTQAWRPRPGPSAASPHPPPPWCSTLSCWGPET